MDTIQMVHIDTIMNLDGTAHSVLQGVTGRIFLNYDVFLSLKVVLTIAYSADPDEMQHYVY